MIMDDVKHFLIFMLEDKTFALPLWPVERVVRAVEITPLPEAPSIIPGIINYKGNILPVVDIRSRFHLPNRELQINHQFIIVRTSRRHIALHVDTVTGNVEITGKDMVPPDNIIEGTQFLKGILKLENGVMLVPDLDKILTQQEEKTLSTAIKNTRKQFEIKDKEIRQAAEK